MLRPAAVTLAVLALTACDSSRRVIGGNPHNVPTPGRDGGSNVRPIDAGFDDAGRPIAIDAGFDDAGRPVMSGSDRANYCAELIRIQCAANERCCTRESGRYESAAACTAELSQRWCLQGAAFEDGRIRFDSARAAQLLADASRNADSCLHSFDFQLPIVGNVRVGGDCTASSDPSPTFSCVPGAYCSGSESAPSTCTAYAGERESCEARACAAPLVCGGESGTCRRGGGLGAVCSELEPCGAGYCRSGTCDDAPIAADYCRGE